CIVNRQVDGADSMAEGHSPRDECGIPPAGERSSVLAESSISLMGRAQTGDPDALNQLCARYLPRLRRWASGRLPRWARDLRETNDLVQDTIVGVLPHVAKFEFRHDGAFQAYLRHALLNRIREEIRRARRRPMFEADEDLVSDRPSPLD